MTARAAGGAPRIGFLTSDRVLARAAQPIVRFLHVEAAGGVLLIVATLVALTWANSPWSGGYASLWSTGIRLEFGSYAFEEDLGHFVNDFLMAIFFFVVGMEIKREMVVGDLRRPRAAALPVFGAVGGMVVPAVIYSVVNAGGSGSKGWGIPMATDIAFALGVVALLGPRVPAPAKLFLLTLAIVDDIGAIVVIAVFYSDSISIVWLLIAAGVTAMMAIAHRLDVVYAPVLGALGVGIWLAVYESGVHATIAGVVVGLLMPAKPRLAAHEAEQIVDALELRQELDVSEVRATATSIKASLSDCDRAIDAFHPWSSFVAVPVFALANAGIELQSGSLTSPSRVLVGVVAGLVVGKLVGVTLFAWLAVRTGLSQLPDEVAWVHVVGLAALAGVGFTVSLFIAGLALEGGSLDDAKVGVLLASLIASTLGALLLSRANRGNGG